MKKLEFYIKVSSIAEIKIGDRRGTWYYYVPETIRKFFGVRYKVIPAHFESGLNFNSNYSAEEIEEKVDEYGQKLHFIDYNNINEPIVYYRPEVTLTINGHDIIKRFDTFEKGKKWVEDLIKKYNLSEDLIKFV